MRPATQVLLFAVVFFVIVCLADGVTGYLMGPDESLWRSLLWGQSYKDVIHSISVTIAFVVFGLMSAKALSRMARAQEAAASARKEWEETFDAVPDLVAVIDRNYEILSMNKAMASRLGISPSDAVGRTCYKLIHDTDQPLPICPFHRLMETGREATIEYSDSNLGGTFILSTSPIRNKEGAVNRCVHVARDITELKRLQEELAASEQRYRAIFESASDPIYLLDLEGENAGKIVQANQRAAEAHGYTLEEFLQLRVSDLDTEDSARDIPRRMAALLDGNALREDVTHRRKDGSVFPVEINARKILFEGHAYSLSIDRDITERKAIEQVLKASEERIRRLIESSPLGICVARQGTCIYANHVLSRIFGYENPSDVIGRSIPTLYEPSQRDAVEELLAHESSLSPTPSSHKLKALRHGGEPFDVAVWLAPIDYEGAPAALLYVADMTQEKGLRDQVLHLQKMEAMGVLAAGVAHDFNNILQVILGYCDLFLMDKRLDKTVGSAFEAMHSAAKRGADLARRLLLFAKQASNEPRPLDLNKAILEIHKLLERTIPKMIDIDIRLQEGLPLMNADPVQIEQVVMNLAINAKDAMEESGGKLTIETADVTLDQQYCDWHAEALPGRYILLTVSDTGCGMTDEVVQRIFEPFFTTKGRDKGSGLGLSIVYGIVQRHGGHITVQSAPGQGTTFRIYFPVADAMAEVSIEPTPQSAAQGTETILVVDDEQVVLDLTAEMLQRAGYTVIKAHDGEEALELFRRFRNEIALVLIDRIMPKMSGIQCSRQLLSLEPKLKIIMASGMVAEEHQSKLAELGVRALVMKPYDVEKLLQTVRRILDAD